MTDGRLRTGLDEVARSAATQLERAAGRDAARGAVGRAMLITVLLPALAVLVQLIRLATGGVATFSWWLTALAILPPLAFVVLRVVTGRHAVARQRALAAVDHKLSSGDRLLTADDFLREKQPTGFMLAAIEDATSFVERGRGTDVTPAPAPLAATILERVGVPAAVSLVLVAFWLSTLTPATTAVAQETPASITPVAAREAPIDDDILPPPAPAVVPDRETPQTRERRDELRETRANAPVSKTIPEGAEEAHGSLGVGETSESDQSSNPSNARGAPSAQGQPSKPSDRPKKKPAKPGKRKPDREQITQPNRDTKDPAGSTAGQGSSKGSNRNPAVSDWSSRDQVNTPDDDQVDEEDEVEDEDEEQDSRGGMQPNLRDRRPPVNRDLRIGFGNRSSPDANGRGGPGSQKKSRGVASLVLGVPIPDRVKGQPNPGKTKVTQQRIEPEPEQSQPAIAETRPPRSGAVGPVFHPVLHPSLRELVRAYFLQQREKKTDS
jgi:hypothetical protein